MSYLLKEMKYTDDVTHLCRTFKKKLIYILDELVLIFEEIMGILWKFIKLISAVNTVFWTFRVKCVAELTDIVWMNICYVRKY